MLFNSFIFVIFLTVFLLLWNMVKNHTRLHLYLIFVFSCIFYGWWDWRFLFLIYFTGTVDFFLAQGIAKCLTWKNEKAGKRIAALLLFLSVAAGLGSLSIFKYSGFFAEEISYLLGLAGIHIDLKSRIPDFCLILPVGISFYTFQSLSYTIDIYRKMLAPTRSWIHYMAYLMLFPQLVAGPIVRAVDLLHKLLLPPAISPMLQYNAVKLIALGYFKKCFLADNAAAIVDMAFRQSHVYTGSSTWFLVMILFSIQIYCDFSGYSDIARGIIKFMGYRFNLNFNHPYAAHSLQDFWSRWHISLSGYFRDYVYIPLGGNRKGKARTCFNLFITFLLSGLWHGAALNFIFWGAYHGILQVIEKITSLNKFLAGRRSLVIKVLFTALTQLEVLVGWVFFRAANWHEALYVLSNMFTFSSEQTKFKPVTSPALLIILFLAMEIILLTRAEEKLLHKWKFLRSWEPVATGLLILLTVLYRGEGYGFIYFQF